MIVTQEKTIENLGELSADLGDIAKNGLGYLLRGVDKTPLMPVVFCKDYFQDFGYANTQNDFEKPSIYGYKTEKYEDFNNTSYLNLTLLPFSKSSNLESFQNSPKYKLAKECLDNPEIINSFKKQLKIFETRLLELKYIENYTEVSYEKVVYKSNLFSNLIENNVLNLKVDINYFKNPQLLSLYLLLIRNFLTSFIFVETFDSLNNFLDKITTFNLKYIYDSDANILNNTNFRLKLPLYLSGNIKEKTWEDFKDSDISFIHNYSGIYSFLTSLK